MDSRFAKAVKETIEECGYDVRSYSGRAMYGDTCLALTCDSDPLGVLAEVLLSMDDDLRDHMFNPLRNVRMDQMGFGHVVYWPNIEWVDDPT